MPEYRRMHQSDDVAGAFDSHNKLLAVRSFVQPPPFSGRVQKHGGTARASHFNIQTLRRLNNTLISLSMRAYPA
jgi:hypothetical protein